MGVRISVRHTGMFLAGIQDDFVDSGQKIAGMRSLGNGRFIVLSCTKPSAGNQTEARMLPWTWSP
jgi:hypothetical protein